MRTTVQLQTHTAINGSVPQPPQKLRPQIAAICKKRDKAWSWWKLQIRLIRTQEKLKESSCPQVVPVRGRKATEMRCCHNPSSLYKANIIKCSDVKNSGLGENEHTSKKESK